MIASVTHGSGATATQEVWTADESGLPRPGQIALKTASGGELWSSGVYSYDGSGNVKQIGSTSYAYDTAGRLRSYDTGGSRTGFLYDRFGNYLGQDPNLTWTCGPVTNGSQRCYGPSYLPPYQVSGTTNHYVRYSYDVAGNVTSDGQRQFTWDALGMLHATSFAGLQGRQFRYLYTADDERIAVIERKRGTDQVYRNRTSWTLRGFDARLLRVLVDDFTSGALVQTWKEDEIWRGSAVLASDRPSSGTLHHALDHLGSPRAMATSTGSLYGTQTFTPFGVGGSSDGGALQFTGHERDSANAGDTVADLPDYFHARYYDPLMGRFLSVDPSLDIKKALREPQMWNRYAYVTNNPLRYTDPDGRDRYQEPGFTKPMTEVGDWSKEPAVSWAFYAQGALLSLAAEEFVIGPAVGRAFGAVGRLLGIGGSGLARGSVTLETAIARGAVREAGALSKVLGGVEAAFKSGAPKTAEAALEAVAKGAEAAGLRPGTLVKASDGAKYVLQNVGDVKTFIYKTGEVIVKKGDDILVRYIPK